MTKPTHDLARIQHGWDIEGATIERGRDACAPFIRPAGELPIWAGTLLVLGWFALLAFAVALLP